MQNSPLTLLSEKTFDMPCPSSGPVDVTNIVGTHSALDSSSFYEVVL